MELSFEAVRFDSLTMTWPWLFFLRCPMMSFICLRSNLDAEPCVYSVTFSDSIGEVILAPAALPSLTRLLPD